MRRLLIILIALCVAGTGYAEDFVYVKKKAAAAEGGGGYATPTRTGAGSAYANNYAPNWTITAGEYIIVGLTGGATLANTACSDAEGAYTRAGEHDAAVSGSAILYKVATGTTTSGNRTVTCSGVTDIAVLVASYSGIGGLQASAYEADDAQGAISSNFDSGAGINNTVANSLYIGVFAQNQPVNTSTYPNYTKVTEQTGNLGGFYEQIVSSTATRDFSGTMASSNNGWGVSMAIFSAAAQ